MSPLEFVLQVCDGSLTLSSYHEILTAVDAELRFLHIWCPLLLIECQDSGNGLTADVRKAEQQTQCNVKEMLDRILAYWGWGKSI